MNRFQENESKSSRRQMRLQLKSNQTTIQEETDHESWRQFHRQPKLKRQREHSHLAQQVVDQEIMAARNSTPVFDEDVFHANMDATAFVNTAMRRKSVKLSCSKKTEEEATEMDETRSRALAEWIQEEAISKVRECQEVPESRLMSMRWVLT